MICSKLKWKILSNDRNSKLHFAIWQKKASQSSFSDQTRPGPGYFSIAEKIRENNLQTFFHFTVWWSKIRPTLIQKKKNLSNDRNSKLQFAIWQKKSITVLLFRIRPGPGYFSIAKKIRENISWNFTFIVCINVNNFIEINFVNLSLWGQSRTIPIASEATRFWNRFFRVHVSNYRARLRKLSRQCCFLFYSASLCYSKPNRKILSKRHSIPVNLLCKSQFGGFFWFVTCSLETFLELRHYKGGFGMARCFKRRYVKEKHHKDTLSCEG